MDMMLYIDSPFGDENAIRDFLFANSQSHSLTALTLEQRGSPIASQPIGDMASQRDWLEVHQKIHSDELAALGIPEMGVDLSQVDLQDKKQYRDWMLQHAYIHQYINAALGLV
jgi:hypothetical protein